MTLKELADTVKEKFDRYGYYSDHGDDKLEDIFVKYLTQEYKKMLKKQTSKIEKEKNRMGVDLSSKKYEEAYGKVEDHLIYVTQLLAANCYEDLEDLKDLV